VEILGRARLRDPVLGRKGQDLVDALNNMVGRARDVIGRGIQEGSNQDSRTHA